jgi:hypothetical protein
MKLNFPKIVKEFSLSEYAPEVKGVISVWVNPSMQLLADLSSTFSTYIESRGAEKFDEFLNIVSQLLSQGKPDTRFSVDELRELYEQTKDADPAFWMWFNTRIMDKVSEHRLGIKKN